MISRPSLQLQFLKYKIYAQKPVFEPTLQKNGQNKKRIKSSSMNCTLRIHVEGLRLDAFEPFVTTSKGKLVSYQCYESFMDEFLAFLIDKECTKSVSKRISNVVLSSK